jgi:hypothetical protein
MAFRALPDSEEIPMLLDQKGVELKDIKQGRIFYKNKSTF